jgi:small subunit ribosomal protein S9
VAENAAIETTLDVDFDEELTEYTSEEETSYSSESLAGRFAEAVPGAGLGRRKEAIARVRIVPGTGKWKINGRTLENYFPNKVHQQTVNEPFKLLELDGRYDVVARIAGGGVSGQAYALRLGVARALNEADVDNNRGALKKAGFLTRDARAVERKKAGLKKARKAPQYSKR